MSADPFTVTPGRVVDPQQLNLYAYVRNNPLRHIDPTGMIIDDAACLADAKHCGNDWQKVQNVANQQDKNGNYQHPELHNVLSALQSDSRTFTLENSKLGAGTVGKYMAGFERSDLTFGCSGSVGIQVSLSPPDLKKYGFLTEQSTVDAMAQLPPGEHPGDNLTARKLRYAPVIVVGLFRCHYDFPTCKGASPDDGSIVVKSMQFNAPMSEVPPAAKPSVSTDTLLHESGHADPPKSQ